MRLFFARSTYGEPDAHRFGVRNRILTYADIAAGQNRHVHRFWVESGEATGARIYLDSGAYSALTRGVDIDIEQYCAYILEHRDLWHCVAGLDVIDNHGVSAENCELMRRLGVDRLMETFHMRDPRAAPEGILDRGDLLALGGWTTEDGRRGATTPDRLQPHLDRCWNIIGKGSPLPKVHLFGSTAEWLLERYPWYSADSGSAFTAASSHRVWRTEDRPTSPSFGRVISEKASSYASRTGDLSVVPPLGEEGDPAAKKAAFLGRLKLGVETQLALEKSMTQLWRGRGVVWPE